ncbi:MAG: mechanosensitive ion channel [Bacteroidales bacterium]|nr:mechanosensitive ion channel [Bacteroidales bacterium]
MKTDVIEFVDFLLLKLYVPEANIYMFRVLILLASLVVMSLVGFYFAKFVVAKIIKQIVKRTSSNWDDKLFSNKFFTRVSYLVPSALIYKYIPFVLPYNPGWLSLILGVLGIYIVFVILLSLYTLIDTFGDIYNDWEISNYKPIKGYLQLVKVLLSFFAGVLILATILGKSPLTFLAGLGALSAVLMLVFKDALLGLVAGIQLSANDMARPGDWITMDRYKADGDVIEIALTTVKVRNFDKTIVYIPAYAMISDSFINWRGMFESEGRRIKRALFIDMETVKFCTPEMLDSYKEIELISDYVVEKQKEIDEYNENMSFDKSLAVNGRNQTNIGIFRMYMQAYLKSLDTLSLESTLMVRQLPTSDKGIPLEVYVFCRSKEWVVYEEIQSDIFDHFYASLESFDLALYQTPSSNNVKEIMENLNVEIKTND